MARETPLISAFNGGELSPYLAARTDFAVYNKGLRRCSNAVPLVQGPLDKRPGSRFTAPAKYGDRGAVLIPFVFAADDAFVLEFGDQYIRFFSNRGQVLSGGSPLEIASPYAPEDLRLLRYVQSADIIYLAHPLYAPRKLTRLSATNWTLEVIDFENGPIGSENTTATTVQAGALTGTVTLTASAPVFEAGFVGGFIQLRHKSNGGIPPWEAGKAVTAGNQRSYDGNFYEATTSGTTAGNPPIHLEDDASDGGVTWRYIHSGFGIARIASVANSQSATAIVTSRLPNGTVSSATPYWSLGDWNAASGYPGAVAFYGDRLFWAGSPKFPQQLWGSVVGDYENHKPGTEDDSALSLRLSAAEVNTVRWMVNDEKGLLVGTTRGEWVVRPSSNNEALTPFNGQASQVSNLGSNATAPTRADRATLFMQSAGRKLREIAYSLDVDGFAAPDMTVRAEHITDTGIVSLAFQAQPDTVVWAVRGDGTLLSFTYERGQEVVAWARHTLGGYADAAKTIPARVKSVTVIPSPDGSRDDVWLLVERYINGATRVYVEYLAPRFDYSAAPEDAVFVDASEQYRGAPATVISGLDHLEGETVRTLVDGATHPDLVVSGGSVTLNSPASVVQLGLPYKMDVVTQNLDAGGAPGASPQSMTSRIVQCIFRVIRSGGFQYGPGDGSRLSELPTRSPEDAMDAAPALRDGDIKQNWNGGNSRDRSVRFVSDNALPCTLAGIMPTIESKAP